MSLGLFGWSRFFINSLIPGIIIYFVCSLMFEKIAESTSLIDTFSSIFIIALISGPLAIFILYQFWSLILGPNLKRKYRHIDFSEGVKSPQPIEKRPKKKPESKIDPKNGMFKQSKAKRVLESYIRS